MRWEGQLFAAGDDGELIKLFQEIAGDARLGRLAADADRAGFAVNDDDGLVDDVELPFVAERSRDAAADN